MHRTTPIDPARCPGRLRGGYTGRTFAGPVERVLPRVTDRFDGFIAGLGTPAGLRVVVGHWPAGTYTFDEVCRVPVDTTATDGRLPGSAAPADAPAPSASDDRWTVRAGPLDLAFTVGRRTPLGALLRAVPRRLATDPRWITAIDVVARRVLPGVRTRGSAGRGRREYYAALDLRRVTGARVVWDGVDQGGLAPVDPPVRFGFGSTPRTPSLVRVVTLIRQD